MITIPISFFASLPNIDVNTGEFLYVSEQNITPDYGYSQTGTSWTVANFPFERAWTDVTYAAEIQQYMTVSGNTGIALFSSNAAGPWSQTLISNTYTNWRGIAWSPVLYMYAAVRSNVAAGDVDSVATGTETAFTMRNVVNGTGADWLSVCWGNDRFVAVGDTVPIRAAYSTNGVSWTGTTGPATMSTCNDVDYVNFLNSFVTVGEGTTGRDIALSSNGIGWTGIAGTTGPWYSVAYSNELNKVVAFGASKLAYSSDGNTWTQVGFTGGGQYEAAAYSPFYGFIAMSNISGLTAGDTRAIVKSTDGVNWSTAALGVTGTGITSLIRGGYTVSTLDPDAQTYLDAVVAQGGTVNSTIETAVNDLFVELKTAGLYSKMWGMYPMIGGTLASHQINGVDPNGGTAGYNMTITGGTHTVNGMQGGYGNTHNPASDQPGSKHRSFYSNLDQSGAGYEWGGGGTDKDVLIIRYQGGSTSYITFNGGFRTYTNLENEGFYVSSGSTATGSFAQKNGVTQLTDAGYTSIYNGNAETSTLMADQRGFGNYQEVSVKRCAFASAGTYLTESEAIALNDIVLQFQTSLGRA